MARPDVLVLLSLGWQRAACLRSVYRRGLRLCVLDVFPCLSPHGLADFQCVAPASDPASLVRALEQAVPPATVTAVMTFHDRLVPAAAALAAHLGLPGLPLEAAARCSDRAAMRRTWAGAGIPQPRFRVLGAQDDVAAALADIGLPALIEPVDGTAGPAMTLVDRPSAGGGPAAVAAALRASPSGRAIVEELIPGPGFSVELVLARSRPAFASVTAKDVAGLPACIEVGHSVPAPVRPGEAAALCSTAAAAATRLGVTDGVLHVEFKMTDDGPVPLELAARPAADHIPDLVNLALDVDLYGAAVDIARGEPLTLRPCTRPGAAAISYSLAAPGRVSSVQGLDRALSAPGVIFAQALVQAGDQLGPALSNRDRAALAIAAGPDARTASARAREAVQLIQIVTTPPG